MADTPTDVVSTPYDQTFFDVLHHATHRSARQLVPELIRLIGPSSVIDLGCGSGTWLSVFREHGIGDSLGVDGAHIDPATLEIPADTFVAADLEQGFTVDRTYDLAVSLEVGEHLPMASAERLVHSLVALAPVVFFSAAVPGQGGVHHVNEQWQDYWAKLFEPFGYVPFDAIRPLYWNDERVSFWYVQNALLYVSREIAGDAKFAPLRSGTSALPLAVVHPRMFEHAIQRERSSRARRLARNLRRLVGRSSE